jgi:membrane-associated protease RseP (regulator of RpoE activity)
MLKNSWKILPIIAIVGINAHFVPTIHKLAQSGETWVNAVFHNNPRLACSESNGLTKPSSTPVAFPPLANSDFSPHPPMSGVILANWTPQQSEAQEAPQMPTIPETPSVSGQDIEAQVQGAFAQVRELGGDDIGWMGVVADEGTPDHAKDAKLTSERGVYVASVQAGSPAEKAGLKKGDVILSYDGENVEGARQFQRLVCETPSGRTINVAVWRDGASRQLSVRIGGRNDQEESFALPDMHGEHNPLPRNFKFHFDLPSAWDFGGPRLGINAQDLNGQLGAYFGTPDGKGVLVTEVLPNTAAEKAGLKSGDVITRVEGRLIDSTSDLRENLRSKSANGEIALGILRRGSAMIVHVKLPKPASPEGPEIIQRVSL